MTLAVFVFFACKYGKIYSLFSHTNISTFVKKFFLFKWNIHWKFKELEQNWNRIRTEAAALNFHSIFTVLFTTFVATNFSLYEIHTYRDFSLNTNMMHFFLSQKHDLCIFLCHAIFEMHKALFVFFSMHKSWKII